MYSVKRVAQHIRRVTTLIALLGLCLSSMAQTNKKPSTKELSLNVLQFNIWQEGTIVAGGFDAIIDEIIRIS